RRSPPGMACWSWLPFLRPERGSGAADGDVAVGGAAAYLDGLVGLVGAGGVLQPVAYLAEAGVHVQPGGGARRDADVEVAGCGAEHDRAADHLADPDAAVGRLGVDPGTGPLDGDAPVGRAHPHLAAYRLDCGLAVGVLDRGGAVDLPDLDLAGTGGDLGVARDAVRGDVAGPGARPQRAGPLQPDVA